MDRRDFVEAYNLGYDLSESVVRRVASARIPSIGEVYCIDGPVTVTIDNARAVHFALCREATLREIEDRPSEEKARKAFEEGVDAAIRKEILEHYGPENYGIGPEEA